MNKTLYMETTKKTPEETGSEIAALLKGYNLTKFMVNYEDGDISGCVFGLKVDGKDVPIKLPVRWEPLWEMAQNGETRYIKDKEQAQRVAWRQSLRWIQAQLAMIDIKQVDVAEVFLPYMLVSENKTLYQHMAANDMKLIEAGK